MSGTQKSSLDRDSGVCRISGVVSSSLGRGMGFFGMQREPRADSLRRSQPLSQIP